LKGGGSLDFKGNDCGNGAVLFNDFVQPGGPKTFSCTTTAYSTKRPKRATDYELRASHVDDGTGPTPVNVDYDPEIAVKDPGGFSHLGLWAVAILGGGLVMWLLVRWFRRQSVR